MASANPLLPFRLAATRNFTLVVRPSASTDSGDSFPVRESSPAPPQPSSLHSSTDFPAFSMQYSRFQFRRMSTQLQFVLALLNSSSTLSGAGLGAATRG